MRKNIIEMELPKSDPKQLSYINKETGDYIKIKCNLIATIPEIKDFFGFIERMKLDGYTAGKQVLRKGVHTRDLIKEYKKLLKEDTIDFSNILNLYEKDQRQEQVALEPVIRFLELFDRKVEASYSSLEVYNSLKNAKNNPLFFAESFEKGKKELKSLNSNTMILNSQIIYNLSINSNTEIESINEIETQTSKVAVTRTKQKLGWFALHSTNLSCQKGSKNKIKIRENRACAAFSS